MNATPNNLINFNSLSLDYLKFITPKIWVLQILPPLKESRPRDWTAYSTTADMISSIHPLFPKLPLPLNIDSSVLCTS
jgi:hypothetical protein